MCLHYLNLFRVSAAALTQRSKPGHADAGYPVVVCSPQVHLPVLSKGWG